MSDVLFSIIHKYTGVHLPRYDKYAQRRDPEASLHIQITKVAHDLISLEMQIRGINRRRIQLAEKITRYLDAGPSDEVMHWSSNEAYDQLEVKLTSWSLKTEEIRMLVREYESAAGWISTKLTQAANG